MYKNGHRGAALMLMAPLTATFGIVGLGMSALAVAVCRLPDLNHDYSWLALLTLLRTDRMDVRDIYAVCSTV
jgi:hypothetical protein